MLDRERVIGRRSKDACFRLRPFFARVLEEGGALEDAGPGFHAQDVGIGSVAGHACVEVHAQDVKTAASLRYGHGVAQMPAGGFADANATLTPPGGVAAPAGFGSSNVVAEARRYLGGNPTGRGSLWCARFMNMVLQHTGHQGTGSDMANSFAHYGTRVSGPQVGAIAVMSRGRRGGHVGIITGVDAQGNPIMISGNNGNRVREAPISRGRIYAYVMPI